MSAPIPEDLQVTSSPEPRSSETTARRRWLQGVVPWLLYAALILCILGLLNMAAHTLQPDQFLQLENLLRGISRFGALAQVVVAAWVVWRWRRLVTWGRRRGLVNKQEHRAVLAMRRKVAGWLALYLVLIPFGPRRLLAAALAWLN